MKRTISPILLRELCRALVPYWKQGVEQLPKPCQADDLVLRAGAKLLMEEAVTRVEGTEAHQSKADAWGVT